MSDQDTLTILASELASAIEPLGDAFLLPGAFSALMNELGWQFDDITPALSGLASPLSKISSILNSGDIGAGDVPELLAAIAEVVSTINGIPSQPAGNFPVGLDVAAFKSDFPGQLVDFLVAEYLLNIQGRWGTLLQLLGVIRLVQVDASGQRPEYLRRTIAWNDLSNFFSDPSAVLRNAYRWGQSDFLDETLLGNAQDLLEAWKLTSHFAVLDPAMQAFLTSGAISPNDVWQVALRAPFLEASNSQFGAEAGFEMLILPETAAMKPGLAIVPYAQGDVSEALPINDELSVQVSADADITGGIAIIARPGRPVDVSVGISGGTPAAASGQVAIALVWTPAAGTQIILIGSADGSRLQTAGITLKAGAHIDSADNKSLFLETQWSRAALVIKPGADEADSFLASLLPAGGLTVNFDFTLGVSTKEGVYFAGGSGLEISIPLHVQLGTVKIELALLAIRPAAGSIPIELSVTVAGHLSVLTAVAENIGMAATFTFPPGNTGNLGPVDFRLGFKPPNGVGVTIDVAGLVGGGFLDHDDAKAEYGGVLQLEFHSYKLTAFGLLATILPTGPGYSLIAMVDAEFPPIQLGLGFTLDGAGGLLGVHRTASVDALRAALTAHTLSNLLFPKNPIANAPQLLTELDTLFPGAAGRLVFGPIVRIEWGTPALLTLDLALVLELPDPVRLVLIAELTVLLPSPDEKLVEIHMSALGTIDFGTCEGALDAVLHDSRLMKFVLHGSMALRVNWSGQKTCLLAVGGVHPKFQPPPGFPKLDRVGISMPSGHITKLNLDGYLAVTSNTLQIGAHVDIFVGVDGFGISGYLSFDTLIQRHPFHFDGDISGGVALSVDGNDVMALRLTGSLTGPAPWNAAGSVSFDVLWWSVTKSFSETFGDSADAPPLDRIDVGQLLRTALSDARNFATLFAPDVPALVTLRTPVAAATIVLAHPGASLSVHQTVVPLGLTIAQYGGSAPLGETRFDITSVSADGVAQPQPLTPVLDDFAPAQFLTLSDDDKLASPSFERLAAGVELDGTTVFGAPITRTVAYDTFFIDSPDQLPREDDGVPTPFPLGVLAGVLVDGSAGRSLLARAANRRYAGPPHLVTPGALDFVVATSDQLTASDVGASAGMSYRQARAALDTELALHPERSGELIVAAKYEVAA